MSNDLKSMSGDQARHGDWNDCPQGELSRMVRKMDASQARTRTRRLIQNSLLGMLLVAGGVVVGGSLLTQNRMMYGGISCTECQSHFAGYHSHLTGAELLEDLGLAESMASHLASCQSCQGRFNEKYPDVLPDEISNSTQRVVRNSLPPLAVFRQLVFY